MFDLFWNTVRSFGLERQKLISLVLRESSIGFLMWLASHTPPTCSSLDYDQLLAFYDVRSLRTRRVQGDVLFLAKLFRGLI